jgi:hypothetical protein
MLQRGPSLWPPGRYRIVVAAYYPTWRGYVAFDAVRIVISR